MSNIEWISIPAFSKIVNLTPEYIRRLVKNGKIEKSATLEKGLRKQINPSLAIEHMGKNISYVNKKFSVEQSWQKSKQTLKSKQNKCSTEDQQKIISDAALDTKQSLSESQRQRALYEAAIKKIELEEKQGQVLQKGDVETDAFNMARLVRDAMLNIPARISAELASMTDTHLINEKIITEINQALEDLICEK